MNSKRMAVTGAVVIVVLLGIALVNRNHNHTNDLSRSLDRASDAVEEGVQDTQRSIKDALD